MVGLQKNVCGYNKTLKTVENVEMVTEDWYVYRQPGIYRKHGMDLKNLADYRKSLQQLLLTKIKYKIIKSRDPAIKDISFKVVCRMTGDDIHSDISNRLPSIVY